MSSNKWMNDQTVVYPYNGASVKNKRKWNTDKYYNMDQLQRCYANRKKPVTEERLPYDSVCIKCSEATDLDKTKVARERVLTLMGTDENVLKLTVAGNARLSEYTKRYCTVSTLNEWIIWHVNYVSLKLFKKTTHAEFITSVLWGITNEFFSGNKDNTVRVVWIFLSWRGLCFPSRNSRLIHPTIRQHF